MAEADFNGDGKPDLVVSNLASSTISILLGNGDGTFQPRVDFAAATGPSDLAVADFNHDGKLDLPVIISGCPADGGTCGNSSISVFLGNGDGTFQTHVDYTIGNGAASFTEADINGDGKLDLAISESDDGKVSVLLGNGDGTLQQKQDFPVDSEPLGIAAADFNGDGRMDLAVGNYLSNNMSVLLQILPSPIATASLAASTLTFTSQPVGSTSSAQTVTLNDTGTAPLAITSITASGDFTATNTCGTTVAAGGGCTINITFTPTAGGARTGSLAITDNSDGIAGGVQTVALIGTATAPAVSLSAPLTFAAQLIGATSSSQSITLTNSGNASLT